MPSYLVIVLTILKSNYPQLYFEYATLSSNLEVPSAKHQTFAAQALRKYVDSESLMIHLRDMRKILGYIPHKMEQVQFYLGRKVQLFYIEFLAFGAINWI